MEVVLTEPFATADLLLHMEGHAHRGEVAVGDGVGVVVGFRQLHAAGVGTHVVRRGVLLAYRVADEGAVVVFRQTLPAHGTVVGERPDGLLPAQCPSLVGGVVLEDGVHVRGAEELHGDGRAQTVGVVVVVPVLIDGEVHGLGCVRVGDVDGGDGEVVVAVVLGDGVHIFLNIILRDDIFDLLALVEPRPLAERPCPAVAGGEGDFRIVAGVKLHLQGFGTETVVVIVVYPVLPHDYLDGVGDIAVGDGHTAVVRRLLRGVGHSVVPRDPGVGAALLDLIPEGDAAAGLAVLLHGIDDLLAHPAGAVLVKTAPGVAPAVARVKRPYAAVTHGGAVGVELRLHG